MKNVKLFEQFINEGLKAGRDEALARAILAYEYAPEGSGREDAIRALGLHPSTYDGNPDNTIYFSAWGKDVIKRLSGARRAPSNVMLGEVVTLAADNGNSYYFDGVDFVEGSKTIIRNAMKMKMTEFIDELIKLKVIETPKY
jgi:hypothetical protein